MDHCNKEGDTGKMLIEKFGSDYDFIKTQKAQKL